MPVFWILVVLGMIALWAFCAFIYKPVGRIGKRIIKDSYDAITKDDHKDFDIIDKE